MKSFYLFSPISRKKIPKINKCFSPHEIDLPVVAAFVGVAAEVVEEVAVMVLETNLILESRLRSRDQVYYHLKMDHCH